MASKKKRKSIEKIMVAIDGSDTSMKAARYGISLAKKFNSDLVAVTVIDLTSLPYAYFLTEPGTRSHDKMLEEKKSEVRKWLDEVESLMLAGSTTPESHEIRIRSEIIEDPFSKVDAAIVQYAESENIDLIVVGSKGRSAFKRILIGSVASGVLSYARCPVMIAR